MLRTARVEDAPAMVDLLRQLGYPGTGAFLAHRLAQLAAHPDALVQVAEVQGVLRGVIALHFIPQLALAGDFCRVAYLCVDEQARSLGIGALLERFAHEEAQRRGCERIELHSSAHRVDAHRFYARLGYEESPKYLAKKP
ncbi:GNAT family N-acetyltransferase [Ramlibacter sp. G-1-2-2]|uniref:GNAT family N-acetyltransferase n=2 Tax=Ramlibacter agri TaxID=2728837 RepID=A0A848GWU8_9BURK|nr:GNAT family N-acetyltransferase [Ramlibacter agri]